MFKFLKKLFGIDCGATSAPPAPYKVEAPVAKVEDQITDAVTTKAPAAKTSKPTQGQKKPVNKQNQGQKKPAQQGTGQKANNGQRRGRKPKAKPAQ